MKIKPIKTQADYNEALETIDSLFDAKPNTPDGDKLDIMVTLVEAYEAEHEPVDFPDGVAALEYYMESRNLSRKDLVPIIGSRARLSEILNRKRSLSLNMIRNLHDELHISADALIR